MASIEQVAAGVTTAHEALQATNLAGATNLVESAYRRITHVGSDNLSNGARLLDTALGGLQQLEARLGHASQHLLAYLADIGIQGLAVAPEVSDTQGAAGTVPEKQTIAFLDGLLNDILSQTCRAAPWITGQ